MDKERRSSKGILILSSGSKVGILKIAKLSAKKRGATLHASDCVQNVPTANFCDKFAIFDTSDRVDWLNQILQYCEKSSIGLVIPTRHGDIEFLANAYSEFKSVGTNLVLSKSECLNICTQKINTSKFLADIGIPQPITTVKTNLENSPRCEQFPIIAKPNLGASSNGVRTIRNAAQLNEVPDDWILQSVAKGQEYTINIYIDKTGKVICSIPHIRLNIDSGEVSQARTKRVFPLLNACEKIATSLPGARGIINVQAFYDADSSEFEIIEINPRIGGGFPLTHQAKGEYIEWLCQEYLDDKILAPFDSWTENLLMMRYREAVFKL